MKASMPENAMIASSRALDLAPPHAEDGAVEEDVFAAGEIRVKAGGDFDQGAEPAVETHATAIGAAGRATVP